ncbi:MAG: peptide-methionine (R)-S-oxide reductase MsrB [Rhodospirillales bacterium]|jgi:peptide-methionine (R)-S-oxide reductase|nr:peptide-methionine (R)-S-oxide reductase MsrB [Rhodospirillales bacterium]MBT4007447.1 peptide-methionine (R)-S-oxide reductase MsrB [Rhodospirillales bacterium]MBT5075553.1 peptide-methionine (R)-S-oxide reductase MsrB [Rhodospirillales bacterium]MBT5112474.1 peptide-methionine (R)-S-oxide reductase MsrB [Rhodospirillales bacterium]MBT5673343.1 peptide-methionine (R)-S-oxide reductase MsrB [Rhodospirillales bacterium]
MTDKITKTNEQWRAQLSADEYRVAREKGTEQAFTGRYWDCHDHGTYHCICCGTALFSSETKFESGSGWPSYTAPIEPGVIEEVRDSSFGAVRTEVVCGRCDAHLGHVFPDGPPPTGLRYCINSVSLNFEKTDAS